MRSTECIASRPPDYWVVVRIEARIKVVSCIVGREGCNGVSYILAIVIHVHSY